MNGVCCLLSSPGLNRVFCVCFLLVTVEVNAQKKEIFYRNDITLIFYCEESFSATTKSRMVETFFSVYPVLLKHYNQDAERQITFYMDTAYFGAAEADQGYVRFSADWLERHPEDLDMVTHEAMHIIQNYPNNAGPMWLVEGIADYARHTYGVNNTRAGWAPTPYEIGQCYCDGYRVTANFLLWVESHVEPGIVKIMNEALRSGSYHHSLWKLHTGKSIEGLWELYAGASRLIVDQTR